VTVDPASFLAGLEQAQAGRPSALSPEETQALQRGLQMREMAHRHQQYLEQAQRNLEAGRAFLAKNAREPGVETLASGLQYRVVVEGAGPAPKETDAVTVHYRGTLVDGTPFDGSRERGSPETIDVASAIPGWREALLRMKVGSQWELFVPTELAYGEEEMARIPPNSALVFELELLAIEPADPVAPPPGPAPD